MCVLALDQQCGLVSRLLHQLLELLGIANRLAIERQHHVAGTNAGAGGRPGRALDHHALTAAFALVPFQRPHLQAKAPLAARVAVLAHLRGRWHFADGDRERAVFAPADDIEPGFRSRRQFRDTRGQFGGVADLLTVDADHDITGDTIQVAFPTKGTAPETWIDATVLGVVPGNGKWTATFQVLIGPVSGDIAPSAGIYDAYVKLTDTPEVPVRKFDSLTIQ